MIVSKYDKHGYKLESYNSLKEAAQANGISESRIYNYFRRKRKHIDPEHPYLYIRSYENKIDPEKYIDTTFGKPSSVNISKYDLKGNRLKTYSSCREAAKDNNVPDHAIHQFSSGRQNGLYKDHPYIYAKGEKDKIDIEAIFFNNRSTTVSKYDLEGNRLETYFSIPHAAKSNNLKIGQIERFIYNKRKHLIKGFPYLFVRGNSDKIDPKNILAKYKHEFNRGVTISAYTMKGEKVATYSSITEAAAKNNISQQSINKFLYRDRVAPIEDHPYVYVRGEADSIDVSSLFRKRRNTANNKRLISKYDKNGNKITTYFSIKKAVEENGMKFHHFYKLLRSRKTSPRYPYIFAYGDDEKIDPTQFQVDLPTKEKKGREIVLIGDKGNVFNFIRLKDAAEYLGVTSLLLNDRIKAKKKFSLIDKKFKIILE